MTLLKSHKHTIAAGIMGYITQAIVNNFAPLLFLTFQSDFNISLSQLAMLVTINFGIQLLTDLVATKLVDKIGSRVSVVSAHILAAIGLVGLGIFPYIFPNAFAGVLLSVFLYAVGGGLIEVMVSPIIESCPTKNKAGMMSFLHSFYCWGVVLVILLSTLFFSVFGINLWRYMCFFWAALPLLNAFYFSVVPLYAFTGEEKGLTIKQLFSQKVFWMLMVLMLCAGAAELSVSQWASAFAEMGLNIDKTLGDLLGPCMFAVLMGLARVFYAKFSDKINLTKFIAICTVLCIATYIVMGLSTNPVLSLIACSVCGFSVGIMWPGCYSIAGKGCPKGGIAMFALLALAGDAGAALGPMVVGVVSDALEGSLSYGILSAIVFPILLLIMLIVYIRYIKKHNKPIAECMFIKDKNTFYEVTVAEDIPLSELDEDEDNNK